LAFRLLGDWRWDAHRQLQQLQGPQAPGSVKARVAALSELLKRIAMARHGRHACAGLHGQAWLDWLSQHDPDGFDWRTQGQCLLQTAYAPEPSATAADPAVEQQLQRLLQATARWINVRPPKPRARQRMRQHRWLRRSATSATAGPNPASIRPDASADPGP
jgi:hypothetical protein